MRTTTRCVLILGFALVSARGSSAQSTRETVNIVVTGGKTAGKFEATGMKGGCTAGKEGANTWGNSLNLKDGNPTDLSFLELQLPDAKAAAGGAMQFLLVVGFGPTKPRSPEYTVDTRPDSKKPSGKGTVTVKDKGTTAIVTFKVETADGVKIDGTIDCKRVARTIPLGG